MQATHSIRYYDDNAEKYFETTKGFDLKVLYDLFLPHIPKGGKILDLGCGGGRDSKYFLEKGYEVTAVDGSPKLSALASQYVGIAVQTMHFQDLDFDETFDGIWASASLLHVPASQIKDVLKRVYRALRVGGTLYVSFRHGEEECDEGDRYFNDQTEESLRKLLETAGPMESLHMSIPDILKSRRGFKFVVSVTHKVSTPHLGS